MEWLREWLPEFLSNRPFTRILDILIVWYLIYKLLLYARGTQMMNLLKGIGVFIVIKYLSSALGFQTIDWVLSQILSWGIVALIVIFQPELRKALEKIGRSFMQNRVGERNPAVNLIDDLMGTVRYASRRKIGMLIVIEGDDNLSEYIGTGTALNSLISEQLLINIFIPNTPLHDGAVIIRDYKIEAASCYLPLSEDPTIPKELGTRHRAAIGMSEATDALVIVVSEETGNISIAHKNEFFHDLDKDQFKAKLEEVLVPSEEDENQSEVRKFFQNVLNNFLQKGDSK